MSCLRALFLLIVFSIPSSIGLAVLGGVTPRHYAKNLGYPDADKYPDYWGTLPKCSKDWTRLVSYQNVDLTQPRFVRLVSDGRLYSMGVILFTGRYQLTPAWIKVMEKYLKMGEGVLGGILSKAAIAVKKEKNPKNKGIVWGDAMCLALGSDAYHDLEYMFSLSLRPSLDPKYQVVKNLLVEIERDPGQVDRVRSEWGRSHQPDDQFALCSNLIDLRAEHIRYRVGLEFDLALVLSDLVTINGVSNSLLVEKNAWERARKILVEMKANGN